MALRRKNLLVICTCSTKKARHYSYRALLYIGLAEREITFAKATVITEFVYF